VPVQSYWVSYAKAFSPYSNDNSPAQAQSPFCYAQIKSSTVVFYMLVFTTSAISSTANVSRSLGVGQHELSAAAIIGMLFILFNSTITKSHAPRSVLSLELVNFIIFCAIAAVLVVLSTNLLTAFFALELLGSIALYAFFVFGGYNISGGAQQSLAAVSSCIYQFVLNFFGSVLLYVSLSLTSYYHNSVNVFGAASRLASGWPLIAQSVTAAALFAKLGTGP
jgi:hypothetical protein